MSFRLSRGFRAGGRIGAMMPRRHRPFLCPLLQLRFGTLLGEGNTWSNCCSDCTRRSRSWKRGSTIFMRGTGLKQSWEADFHFRDSRQRFRPTFSVPRKSLRSALFHFHLCPSTAFRNSRRWRTCRWPALRSAICTLFIQSIRLRAFIFTSWCTSSNGERLVCGPSC